MKTIIIILFPVFATSLAGTAQFTQTIRGTVLDNTVQTPLHAATVAIAGSNKKTVTDANGNFRFNDIPAGLQTLMITCTGYKEATMANVQVNAGKEIVLNIFLTENITTEATVVLKNDNKKNKPLNDMSVVSSRAFTVEETQKYAASISDPARMATNFAGVASADDGSNNIVIRGNAPTGLLWRMEGIDIPNPNHFSSPGSSGGGVSIISSQLLANSDFVTGAFAGEYGNALSGVFDLKLRRGNNEKKEVALQAGFLGINGALEGPVLKQFYKGSYLINYRFSTLSLFDKLGFNLSDGAPTNFQDLSYNIYLPTRCFGNFSLFGFGGLSSQTSTVKKDSAKWITDADRYSGSGKSNTTLRGFTHSISFGNRANLKTAVAYSKNKVENSFNYVEKNYSISDNYKDAYDTKKLVISSTLNYKLNRKNTLKTGAIVNFINFNYYKKSRENPAAPLLESINTKDKTQTVQAFAQWQHKTSEKITINTGFHYLKLLYNNTASLEPRFALKWELDKKNVLSFGYGFHSQVQALGVYFAQVKNTAGVVTYPNKNLDLSKAQHYVLSYSHQLNNNLKIKSEIYYQRLFNIPVSADVNKTFSTLNIEGDFILDPLINKGSGKNYGLEISLEKYLSKNYYFMFSNSLYKSRYKALDGVERNTKYNGNYIGNFVGGKDFVAASQRRTFGVNLRMLYTGGYRTTPINFVQSQLEGITVFKEQEAFSLQNPYYFRTDLRLSVKWNRKHTTSTLSLDIQNLTNRKNLYNETYDAQTNRITKNYQLGLLPILNYKVEF